jgi:flavin reductase (DIM6/NTAB) family NADH-FMN oxidoreductase RutF
LFYRKWVQFRNIRTIEIPAVAPNLPFDARRFRDVLGCFATGVAIVTTRRADGAPEGLTVNSFSSVSLDPPLVLFSLDRRSRCGEVFREATHFAIHILAHGQTALSRAFAVRGGADWSAIEWRAGIGGCPLLPGELATLQAEAHARYEGGDHEIHVVRVLAVHHSTEGEPLLYFRGRYRDIAPVASRAVAE